MKTIVSRKIKMFLKWVFCGLFTQLIFTTSLVAADAQEIKSVRESSINIEFSNNSLIEAFNMIEDRTEYYFAFEKSEIDNSIRLNKKYRGKTTVADVLLDISAKAKLKFKQINQSIIVSKNKYDSSTRSDIEVIIEGIPIKGKVTTDDVGSIQGVPGVNIIVKGTTNGTITDADGDYNLEVPDENAVLVFSSVGFLRQEVLVGSNTVIDINLIADITALNEIVVVGYGSQKRSDITGAVASVKTKDLRDLPHARVDQALQGRAAGLDIVTNDGSPNSNISIRIRGANSITGTNNPLIVVDGAQGGNLSRIHPNDIESIEVLKDASATAIYGSLGANGVILITTKSGGVSKPKVTYNGYGSTHSVRNELDLLDAGQYAQAIVDNDLVLGNTPRYTDAEIADFVANGGTDWQDEIFRTGISQSHRISISGGSEEIQYNISGDYLNNKGVVLNSSYERFSIRPNFTVNIRDNLKLQLNSYASWSDNQPSATNTFQGPIYNATIWAPTKPVYEADGSYSFPGGGIGPPTNYNPVAEAVEPIRDNLSNAFTVNPSLTYEPIDGLSITVRAAYRLLDTENSSYNNDVPRGGNASNRSASIINSRTTFFQNSNIITYEKEFGKHSLQVTGLYEVQKSKFNSSNSSGTGFLTDNVTYNNLSLADNPGVSSNRSSRQIQSFMGRVNYSYADKYLVTVTGRSDGSSVFGANNKRAFFPSIALGWNISRESFLVDSDVVSDLKLRGSVGSVGNQGVGPYTSLSQLNTTAFVFDGVTRTVGVQIASRAPNPDLKWETTEQINVGVDLGLLGGRVSLTADYYKKTTEDLLLSTTMPASSGFTSKLVNVGSVENKGFELTIGATPIDKDLTWNTTILFSTNDNKVLALNDGVTDQLVGSAGLPGFNNSVWLEVGQPMGLFRGYVYDGVWTSDEASEAAEFGAFPGAPKFVDQNGDNMIGDADYVNIGHTMPDFSFGWNNTLTYKNFELNIFIQGVEGRNVYNLGRVNTDINNGDSDATSKVILNRWSPSNENTDVPSFEGTNAFPNLANSRWMEDGSYIRLKNLSLAYNIPESLLDKAGIGSLRFYLTGTNLFTITDYTGYDPESRTSSTDTRAGVDLGTYPSQKIFTIGMDLTF